MGRRASRARRRAGRPRPQPSLPVAPFKLRPEQGCAMSGPALLHLADLPGKGSHQACRLRFLQQGSSCGTPREVSRCCWWMSTKRSARRSRRPWEKKRWFTLEPVGDARSTCTEMVMSLGVQLRLCPFIPIQRCDSLDSVARRGYDHSPTAPLLVGGRVAARDYPSNSRKEASRCVVSLIVRSG